MHTRLGPAAIVSILIAPAIAHAGDVDPAWAWGLASGEVATIGYASLRFTDRIPGGGVAGTALNLSPMAIGAGVGLLAYHYDLDGRPAYAMHGAAWGAFDLFLAGMLVDGRHDRSGLAIGPATYTLAAVGALAGGYLGGATGTRAPDAWMAFPAFGFMGGGVVGGLLAVTSDDSDHTARRLIYGVAGGTAVGLVAAAVFGHTQPGATTATAIAPSIEPGPDRVMFSLGGAF